MFQFFLEKFACSGEDDPTVTCSACEGCQREAREFIGVEAAPCASMASLRSIIIMSDHHGRGEGIIMMKRPRGMGGCHDDHRMDTRYAALLAKAVRPKKRTLRPGRRSGKESAGSRSGYISERSEDSKTPLVFWLRTLLLWSEYCSKHTMADLIFLHALVKCKDVVFTSGFPFLGRARRSRDGLMESCTCHHGGRPPPPQPPRADPPPPPLG